MDKRKNETWFQWKYRTDPEFRKKENKRSREFQKAHYKKRKQKKKYKSKKYAKNRTNSIKSVKKWQKNNPEKINNNLQKY